MRRIFCMVLIALAIVATGVIGVPVRAADPTPDLNDQQMGQVRQNCQPAQSLLQRLQTTDVATRVNRGRIYESLLNRLIAPFDSRVALNHYDASSLNSSASAISQKFNDFKKDYVTYSDHFSKLLSMNCQADPRGFYDLLVTTRNDRSRVADDVNGLSTLLDRYTAAFSSLQASIEGHS